MVIFANQSTSIKKGISVRGGHPKREWKGLLWEWRGLWKDLTGNWQEARLLTWKTK